MKKHSLLMLLPCALIATGCSGLAKGSVFNKKFIKQNFASNPVVTEYEVKAPERVNLNLGEGVTASKCYSGGSSDLLEVTKDGKYGRFCLTSNTYTIPLSAEITTMGNVQTPAGGIRMFAGTKQVDGKTVGMVFDDYGNKIYEGPNGAPLSVGQIFKISRSEAEKNSKEYFYEKIILGSDTVCYAFYNVDRTLSKVLTPDEFFEKYPFEAYGESLADFGHKELRYKTAAVNGETRYSVFNTKKAKFVSSFVIPEGAVSRMVGNTIVYQIRDLLPARAEKFDYNIGDAKYNVETFSVNYLTGKVSKINTKLLLNTTTFTDQKNEKGYNKYLLLEQVQQINKDKTISTVEKDLIVNEKLKVVADVSGINYKSLRLFDEKHLVSDNGFIYDFKLKETGYSGSNTPVISVGNKKTIIDYTGKYLVSPIYDSITLLCEGKYYLFETEDAFKFGKINEKGAVEFYKELSKTDYSSHPASYGSFEQFKLFTKVSDSSRVMFDARTGEELTMINPDDGSTNLDMMSPATNCGYSLGGSVCFYNQAYSKDGSYYMIRHYVKLTYDFPSMK